MLQKSTIQKFAVSLSLLSLLACGGKGGFETATLTATDGSNNSASTGGGDNGATTPGTTNPAPVGDAYQKLQYKGYVSGGNNDGTLVVDIDKAANALVLILPLQLNPFIGSAQGEIPDLPGVKFVTYKDDKGASYLAVSVPLEYVRKGASFLDSARLPNGDPLPQVASGELPSLGISLPGKNKVMFHLYIGVNVVGVYVSSPYNPYIALQFPIRKGVETIGYFHTVPAKAGFNGGFFLNTQMPDSIAAIIDDHFRF